MIIIGERINTSRPAIKSAVEKRDAAFIKRQAILQSEAGSQFIDVNCGLSADAEADDMEWLIKAINEAVKVGFSIDSPNPKVIERGIAASKEKVIINSITAEKARYRQILPLILKHRCGVIALTMDKSGMPDDAEGRFKIARNLYKILKSEGIPDEDIYFDPLVRPVSSEPAQAAESLKSIPMIKSLGNVKIVCGISNISYGLPRRSLLNSVFLSMAFFAGMDAALIDPLDRKIMACVKASEALLGRDKYCADFIKAYRKGIL